MAHFTDYSVELAVGRPDESSEEQLMINFYARYRDENTLVIRYFSKSLALIRNLSFTYSTGYLYISPNDIVKKPRSNWFSYNPVNLDNVGKKEGLHEWEQVKNLRISEYKMIYTNYDQIEEIVRRFDKKLVYLFQKYKKNYSFNIYEFIDLCSLAKEHAIVESLVDYGLKNVALDKRLYKLTEKKKKEIIQFIKEQKAKGTINDSTTLQTILFCAKNKIDCTEYDLILKYGSLENYHYISKQNIPIEYYRDYLELAKQARKDLKDKYWLFPKDCRQKHDELLLELEEKKKFEEELKKKKFQEYESKLITIKDEYFLTKKGIVRNYQHEIGNRKFIIPFTKAEMNIQAQTLNQCLCRANYSDKIQTGKSIIVMVQKNDIPEFTFEIDYEKKIIQIYGNHNNACSTEQKEIANEFLESLELRKTKSKRNELFNIIQENVEKLKTQYDITY